MKINVAVNVKPFPVPIDVATDHAGATADTTIPLNQLDSHTLAQMCQEFTTSVYRVAGKDPVPTKRTRVAAIKHPEGCSGIAAVAGKPAVGKAAAAAAAAK